jgi:hypothetical protein
MLCRKTSDKVKAKRAVFYWQIAVQLDVEELVQVKSKIIMRRSKKGMQYH